MTPTKSDTPTERRWLLARPWRIIMIAIGVLVAYLTTAKFIYLGFETYLGFSHCGAKQSPLSTLDVFQQAMSDLAMAVAAIASNGFYYLYIVRLRKDMRSAFSSSWFVAAFAVLAAAYWYSAGSCDELAHAFSGKPDEWTTFWHRGWAHVLVMFVGFMFMREASVDLWWILKTYEVHAYGVLIVPWFGVAIGQIGVALACYLRSAAKGNQSGGPDSQRG